MLLSSCGQVKETKEFFTNGKIKSILREEDSGKSEKIIYDSAGALLSIERSRYDTLNGESLYYKGGIISEVINYKHGILDGLYKRYYPDGNLFDSVYYEMGNKRGSYTAFYAGQRKRKLLEAYYVIVGKEDYVYFSRQYDESGNVVKVSLPVTIEMCAEGELDNLLKVRFKIDVERAYDSAKIVIGDFDETFDRYSFSDTLTLIGNTCEYIAKTEKFTSHYLRGSLIRYKTFKNKNFDLERDSVISKDYTTFNYFEEKISSNQPKCGEQ